MRLFAEVCRFSQELPHMDQYHADGTMTEMGTALHKAVEDFEERVPKELKAKPFRPPGVASPDIQRILFPSQYAVY
ncbi:MAG: hypothetical protein LRZ84_14375 [Desertifilum sp.]|nr:hypothetical protein [Desertifilum sp.]